jgi:TIR domain
VPRIRRIEALEPRIERLSTMPQDVFISHSSLDGRMATAVCAGLEASGLRCWMAPRDIAPGQAWGASIVHALDTCPVMVLVLTAQANASRHVVREVERADGKLARIITFRVHDVPLNPSLEYFLSADHWFDAIAPPLESHLAGLVQAVKRLLELPRQAMPQAAVGAAQRPALNDRELVQAFDELAPDDWNRAPAGKLGRFFQGLFADR